jgi:ferrous iron transport protein A
VFALTKPLRNAYVSPELKPIFNNDESGFGDASPVPLAELAPGDAGVIVGLESNSPIGRRLGDLGFLPGTAVVALGRAPLGDPSVYEVRGSRFCLRRSEALRIAVRRGTAPTDG